MASMGKGVAKASPAKVSKGQGSGQVAEQGKASSSFTNMPWNKPNMMMGEAALPEWKLNCLCAEYGLPPTVRGNLKLSGCF